MYKYILSWKFNIDINQSLKYSIILIQVVGISSEESKNSDVDVFDFPVDDFEEDL